MTKFVLQSRASIYTFSVIGDTPNNILQRCSWLDDSVAWCYNSHTKRSTFTLLKRLLRTSWKLLPRPGKTVIIIVPSKGYPCSVKRQYIEGDARKF